MMSPQVRACLVTVESCVAKILLPSQSGELTRAVEALRNAIQKAEWVYEQAIASRGPAAITRQEIMLDSLGIDAVLRRAWTADPIATEHDLIRSGRSRLAQELGYWWMGECHRAAQAGGAAEADAREL